MVAMSIEDTGARPGQWVKCLKLLGTGHASRFMVGKAYPVVSVLGKPRCYGELVDAVPAKGGGARASLFASLKVGRASAMNGKSTMTGRDVRARADDEEILQILHLRETTDLTAEEVGQRAGRSRSAVLGIEKRIRDSEEPCACIKPENMDGGMPPRWWSQ